MVYSDTITKQGMVQAVDFLVDSDSTIYTIEDKTRNFNTAMDKATSAIIGADGRWQWDDTNATDLPIGLTDIMANQQDYSFDSEYLTIDRIELKNTSGNWILLKPIDQFDITESLTDYKNSAGVPEFYDKVGESIFLYPKPNFSQASSLKAYFQRKALYFTTGDSIKEPGFAKHLHMYLVYCVAYDFALAKSLPKVNSLKNEVLMYESSIKKFYSYRPKDERPRMSPSYQNNK